MCISYTCIYYIIIIFLLLEFTLARLLPATTRLGVTKIIIIIPKLGLQRDSLMSKNLLFIV